MNQSRYTEIDAHLGSKLRVGSRERRRIRPAGFFPRPRPGYGKPASRVLHRARRNGAGHAHYDVGGAPAQNSESDKGVGRPAQELVRLCGKKIMYEISGLYALFLVNEDHRDISTTTTGIFLVNAQAF